MPLANITQLEPFNLDSTASYTFANATATSNVVAGNVNVSGIISASGNIYADVLIGNGSQLTGVVASSVNTLSSLSVTGNITGGNLLTGGLISATGNVTAGNVSATNLTGTLLTASQTNITAVGTLSSLTVTANVTGGNILTGGLISATGNITGNYFIGNGSQLTGLPATYSNANVAAYLPTYSGNISANNISVTTSLTGNIASLSGNVTGGNLLTAGLISATATITGGNVNTDGNVSATGNVTGGNVLTGGVVSATGNVTGGNVNTSTVRSTGAITVSTGSGNLNLSPTSGNIVVNSTYINGVNDPVQNQDVATKSYVDTMVSAGIAYHQPVLAATTTTLASTTGGTITYTQPNGVSNGVGAYITTTGSFNLIDTANVQTANTRILVKDEANAVLNGVYYWSNATTIIRTLDTDEYGPDSTIALSLNDYFFVQSGNVNAGSAYVVSAPSGTITFGTSNITFAQFSSSQTYTANNSAGLTLNGTVFNAKVDDNTTAFDGTGNIIVKANANLTTPNIGAATGTSLNTTDNVTGGNLLTGGLISATANVTGGNITTAGLMSSTGNAIHGNILTGGLISATSTITSAANVAGDNLTTGGQVSATANITGGNILTAGIVSSIGNIISIGNVSGGNILTTGIMSSTGNAIYGNMSAVGLTTTASLSITGNTATVTSANYSIGYLNIPQVSLAANSTAALTDSGKHYYTTSASNLTLTLADNSAVSWPIGTALTVVNRGTANVTVAGASGVSLYLAGNSTAGNRVVTTYGVATVINVAANIWMINGTVA